MRLIKFLVLPLLLFVSIGFAQERGKNIYKAIVDPDGIQRVTVLGGEYFYDPDYIVVKVDVPVEITIKKEPGLIPHNMVIKEIEAGIDIRETISAEPKVIKFTPRKAGKYSFHCDKKLLFLKSHRERGMEGILEVTE